MRIRALALCYMACMAASLCLALLEHQQFTSIGSVQSFPIQMYQRVIGTLDGRSCPSYPVCSQYARQAIQKHGLLLGSWWMLDRMIHEADDVYSQHTIVVDGVVRTDDRLQRNDFWWH